MLRIREDRQALVRRIEVSRVAAGAILSLLAVAYWFIQIARGEHYFSLSENNRIRAVKITAPRGYVLDQRHDLVLQEVVADFDGALPVLDVLQFVDEPHLARVAGLVGGDQRGPRSGRRVVRVREEG